MGGNPKVSISELVQEMETQMDEMPVYFNTKTGEFVYVEEWYLGDIEDGKTKEDYSQDWQKEAFETEGIHPISCSGVLSPHNIVVIPGAQGRPLHLFILPGSYNISSPDVSAGA